MGPPIQPDDVDKDLLYNQYPYQERDDYDDNEEDMEVDDRMLGGAGDACMAAPTSTWHPYWCPPASYATYSQPAPGSPRSIHTDTDTAMEFDTLKVTARAVPPAKEVSALELADHLTKVMASAAVEVIDRLAQPLPVTDATDTMVIERFLQRRMTARQTPSATGRFWERLAHHQQTPPKEGPWVTWPEMMPRKVERGRQPERSQESGRSTSRVAQDSSWSTSQKR